MSKTLQERIIEGALKIISDPKRWTDGADAEDAEGNSCRPDDASARKFCARGALRKAGHDLGHQIDHIYSTIEAVERVNAGYIVVNDGPDGRRQVMAIFKKALKNLRT